MAQDDFFGFLGERYKGKCQRTHENERTRPIAKVHREDARTKSKSNAHSSHRENGCNGKCAIIQVVDIFHWEPGRRAFKERKTYYKNRTKQKNKKKREERVRTITAFGELDEKCGAQSALCSQQPSAWPRNLSESKFASRFAWE